MHPYVKTALWLLAAFVILTHPQIVTHVFNSLTVFLQTLQTPSG